jgi:AraC-like DNA-binding protein
MDGARLSPLPHFSWFGFPLTVQPTAAMVHEHRQKTHTLVVGTAGAVDVRWTCRARERRYHHGLDQIAFFRCDDESHVHVARACGVCSSAYVLHMPRHHLDDLAAADGLRPPGDCRAFLPLQDAVLRECMLRLRSPSDQRVACDLGPEIAARRLVSRLIEVLGGRKPEWHDDTSVFTRREMNRIVDYIDSRLRERHQFCLHEIASLVELSPSHCATKVRQTVGLSLCRFIHRRRVARAMTALRDGDVPLAELSLDLGFSSQSHFTRLFSQLTGMTPAKYRRRFRRTVG